MYALLKRFRGEGRSRKHAQGGVLRHSRRIDLYTRAYIDMLFSFVKLCKYPYLLSTTFRLSPDY